MTDCPRCHGEGVTYDPVPLDGGTILVALGCGCDTGVDMSDCPTCDGTGAIRHPRWGSPSCPDDHITCPTCSGRGH